MSTMTGHFSSLLAAEATDAACIPVIVLTGFLGSGKTTRLNQLLGEPDMDGTVVIVNEFGEIGLDHDLIAAATDDTVLLPNGCLCCAMRGDLAEALATLAGRTDRPLCRVLLETSGLADPGPILRTLMSDPVIRRRYVLACVVCTVDAVLGAATLDQHPEAVRQAAVADLLLLTKQDLVQDDHGCTALLARLQALNPQAHIVADRAAQSSALRRVLLEPPQQDQVRLAESAEAPDYRPSVVRDARGGDALPGHRDGIASFVLIRDDPLPREAFAAWLDLVIAARGEDLLRVKGLVQLADDPAHPLVVHGVQHLFQPPQRLPAWPSQDHRTRIVFITRGIDGAALGETLDVLVRRHARRVVTRSG